MSNREVTKEYIIEKLREIAEEEDAAGVKTRALELLGKHIGMFQGKGNSQSHTANNLLQVILVDNDLKKPEIEEGADL